MKEITDNKKTIKGSTTEFWLSPEEKGKLIDALALLEGYAYLAIVTNLETYHDIYYVNGKEVFKRNIK